jgi:hypothetical protein
VVRLATIVCDAMLAQVNGENRNWRACNTTPTLVIHLLVWLAVWRVRLVVRIDVVTAIFRHRLLNSTRGRRCRILLRLVADGRKLNGPCAGIRRRRLRAISLGLVNGSILSSCGSLALALFFSLALLLFLLLPRLPLFADFFEFCN